MITEVLITLNIPEEILFEPDNFPYPVNVLRNTAPGDLVRIIMLPSGKQRENGSVF